MLMIMEQDKTYKYFQTALNEWIDNKRHSGEAPQKILAIRMGIKNCLKNGSAFCSYYVEGTLFFCTMKRISSQRVKVVEIADLG